MPDQTQLIGIIAGICTGVSLLPQLIKIIKDKKADDISYFICLFFILFWPDGTYHDKIFIALCVIVKILSWTFHVVYFISWVSRLGLVGYIKKRLSYHHYQFLFIYC